MDSADSLELFAGRGGAVRARRAIKTPWAAVRGGTVICLSRVGNRLVLHHRAGPASEWWWRNVLLKVAGGVDAGVASRTLVAPVFHCAPVNRWLSSHRFSIKGSEVSALWAAHSMNCWNARQR